MTPMLANIWMPDLATMRLVLPELLLVATLAVLLIAPIMVGRHTRLTGWIALVGAAVAALAAVMSFDLVNDGGVALFGVEQVVNTADTSIAPSMSAADEAGVTQTGPGIVVADKLGMFFRLFLMVFLVGIIMMWFWFDAARERHAPEFFTLLIASALGMALMATSVNLIMMAIAIELASMPSFALVAFDRHRRAASEASIKYVIFGAVTSGFMIYGISLLFGLFGTLHIPTLVERLATTDPGVYSAPLLAVALIAVFAGIGFKVSAVPFHFWCPDAFEGASLPVATWLSVASKAAGLVLLLRLVGLFAAPNDLNYVSHVLPLIATGLGIFAVLTCTWANFAAYFQNNVRRMLAYSSIAHAGYMIAAGVVVVRSDELSAAAMSAVIAYLLIYMFMNFGAFLSIGLVASDTGSEDMEAFTGLGWRDPGTAASLTICLVSLVGLPPLGGFIAKWWLLWALAEGALANSPVGITALIWTLVFVIVINTAISLYYYMRVIKQMYLRGIEDHAGGSLHAPMVGKMALHVCAVVLLLTGTFMISSLKKTADGAVQSTYAAPAFQGPAVVATVPHE